MSRALDDAWPFGLRDQQVEVLTLRLDHTLAAIGKRLGLTRERIRQIEKVAESELLQRAKEDTPGVLNSLTECLAHTIAAHEQDLARAAPSREHARRHVLLRLLDIRSVVLWRQRLPEWWTGDSPTLESMFKKLVEAAPFHACELPPRAQVAGLPVDFPVSSVLASWRSPVRLHDAGPWWVRKNAANRDASLLWLIETGEPRAATDIADALGTEEHATREALRRDERFVQLRPSGLWALAEWNLQTHNYRTALDAVVDILKSRGPLRYQELLSEMAAVYPVTSWRVQQCLTSEQIGRMSDGRVGLIADGAALVEEPEPAQPSNVVISSDGQLIASRLFVDADVLRGSGLPFPHFVAWRLGLRHAPAVRSFSVFGSDNTLTISRQLGMIQISSLRRYAQLLDLVEGCRMVVMLNLDGQTVKFLHGCRAAECPKDGVDEPG